MVYSRIPLKGTTDQAAKQTKLYVAVDETYPTPHTITLSGAVAADAVSMTVVALTEPVKAGTYLIFEDADQIQRMVKVTADAAAAAVSLTIDPAPRAIADATTAEYPSRVWDRSNVDIDQSAGSETVNTFEAGTSGLRVAGSIERSMTSPGFWRPNDNPGYAMCDEAFQNGTTLWFSVEYPAPDGATAGRKKRFRGIVTSMPVASDSAGFIQGDIEVEISGNVTDVPETYA